MHYIHGTDRHQSGVFTSLEDQISEVNYVKLIDLISDHFVGENLDLFQQKGQTTTGRKAYPPSVLLKIYIYGYLKGSQAAENQRKRVSEILR